LKNYRYRIRIQKIHTFCHNYSWDKFITHLNCGSLDGQFKYIFNEIKWLREIKFITKEREHKELLDTLEKLRDEVLQHYFHFFRENIQIDDGYINFAPKVIIIMAGSPNKSFIKERVERTVSALKDYPDAKILVSKAGEKHTPEELRDLLSREGNIEKDRILLETDSLDVMGSALFTKLLLKQNDKISAIKDILIIASPYQIINSTSLFQKIYGDNFRIRVASHSISGIDFTEIDQERETSLTFRKNLVLKELGKLYGYSQLLDIGKFIKGDESYFFFQMLIYHDLYRSKFYLLRKYGLELTDI